MSKRHRNKMGEPSELNFDEGGVVWHDSLEAPKGKKVKGKRNKRASHKKAYYDD